MVVAALVCKDGIGHYSLSLAARWQIAARFFGLRALDHLDEVLLCLGLCRLVSRIVLAAIEAINKHRLRPIFKVPDAQLALKVKAPRVKFAISRQGNAVL